MLVHCGGYFYGSVDCFGRRRPLHDSMSVTGVIAGSLTEHALADNLERMSTNVNLLGENIRLSVDIPPIDT